MGVIGPAEYLREIAVVTGYTERFTLRDFLISQSQFIEMMV